MKARIGLAVLAVSIVCAANAANGPAPLSNPVATVNPLPVRSPAAQAPSKSEVLNRLKTLQSKLSQEISGLETSIKAQLKDSTAVSLKEDLKITDTKISHIGDKLDQLQKRRSEVCARRDFVNQLILVIDSRWNGQDLQTFLQQELLDMASNELTNPQGEPSPLWKFITYLSVAIREVPERHEDILSIAESYMNFANVLNPKTPAEFLANRNYTNGETSVAAQPADRANLGEYLEKRMREIQPTSATSRASHSGSKPNIELRLKAPTPPPEEPAAPAVPAGPQAAKPTGTSKIAPIADAN